MDFGSMSALEIVRYVKGKLLEQDEKAMEGTRCCYGDEAGRHCAVGWLIPEGHPAMGSHHVVSLAGEHGLLAMFPDLWMAQRNDLLIALRVMQSIHDLLEPSDWERAFTVLEEICVDLPPVPKGFVERLEMYASFEAKIDPMLENING